MAAEQRRRGKSEGRGRGELVRGNQESRHNERLYYFLPSIYTKDTLSAQAENSGKPWAVMKPDAVMK